MNNEMKAKEIAEMSQYLSDFPHHKKSVKYGAIEMTEWKDEQIKQQLNSLKDEIQSNLCASSGFNDEYSHGYQDCGMKVMEMIDKILEL